jgi:DNA-binding CsgD family transcriptional regulator
VVAIRLIGRRSEREVIDRLLTDVVAGRSRTLVLRGEAGVGKSALLEDLSERVESSGGRLATAVGIESEMELAYSGLHQLCGPFVDRFEGLPVPQREALATVFGVSEGPPPGRFLVGLATLTLLADVAEQQPLVCVVEDAHWLDKASAQVLAFVARRLLAERVALLAAARTGIGDAVLAGLPELLVDPLSESDARALLLENLIGPLDVAICDQIVGESHGNPLAILEFPRTWSAAELAGGFGLPETAPMAGRIEETYVRRLQGLPADTQLLVLAATAEPVGDPILLHTAAKTLEIDMTALDAAVDAGLLTVGRRVQFTHPLVRSSTYRSAASHDRHRVHRALADATDPDTDPDRRAWHLARSSAGLDEEIAAELERSAGRAQARGGVAAAAAFLQRAVELTEDPARRAERALAAAEANLQGGAFESALALVATATAGSLDARQRARSEIVSGQVSLSLGRFGDAAGLLRSAARELESFDLRLSRETYLTAWGAGLTAAGESGGGDFLQELRTAVEALPPSPDAPRPLDLLLEGLALLTSEGHAVSAPILRRATPALLTISVDEVLRWGWVAVGASTATWNPAGFRAIAERNVQLVRSVGALGQLPLYLGHLSQTRSWDGDLAGAALLNAESEAVSEATGSRFWPSGSLRLLALRGREASASVAITTEIQRAAAAGRGMPAASWAASVLYNGLARYEEAATAAREATANTFDPWHSMWALPELVEAASRIGNAELAHEAIELLARTTQPAGTDFALGLEARSRALLSTGEDAHHLYRQAIDHLARSEVRTELARAHLLYGEWLRREGRRVEAREQLRQAYDLCSAIGMEAFADRARRELSATGEKVRKRSPETRDELTPQEEQIARLARDGYSNPEIAAQLFISARTVEWHLRKVFSKLGVTSRRQLRTALPESGRFPSS